MNLISTTTGDLNKKSKTDKNPDFALNVPTYSLTYISTMVNILYIVNMFCANLYHCPFKKIKSLKKNVSWAWCTIYSRSLDLFYKVMYHIKWPNIGQTVVYTIWE